MSGTTTHANKILADAEQLRSAGRLSEARDRLEALLAEQPDCDPAIFLLAQIAANSGDIDGCLELLNRAVEIQPHNATYRFRLGNVYEMLHDPARAIATYEQALLADPQSVPGLLKLGALNLVRGDRDAAVDAYQRVVMLAGPVGESLKDPRLPPAMRGELQKMQATLRRKYEDLLDCTRDYLNERHPQRELQRIEAAFKILLGGDKSFAHPKQRPEFLYFPELPAIPWFDSSQFPWAPRVGQATADIRREFEAVRGEAQRFKPYIVGAEGGDVATREGTDFSTLAGNRAWSALHLNKAGRIEENCIRCPDTDALMTGLPLAEAEGYMPEIFFSVLQPGTRIVPHYGQMNIRLTVHLALIVPDNCGIRVGDETRHWREGSLLAFDDSFEHEAWNNSDTERVVLIFEVWHPHLTPAEIDGLQHFFCTRTRWLADFGGSAADNVSHA